MALSQSLEGLRLASKIVGSIPIIGEALTSAVEFAITAGEIVEKTQENDSKKKNLIEEATNYLYTVVRALTYTKENNPKSLEERAEDVENFASLLREIMLLSQKKRRKLLKRIWNQKKDADLIERLQRRLIASKGQLNLLLELKIQEKLEIIGENQRNITASVALPFSSPRFGNKRGLMERLNPVHSARHDWIKSTRRTCTEGTRIEILGAINEWILNEEADSILWLNGPPGSGKSTIAQTVCEELSSSQPSHLGASFFFLREEEEPERCKPQNVVRTLAFQLSKITQLKELIMDGAEQEVDIQRCYMREQLRLLLAEPLSQAVDLPSPLVIVLDGLDQCDDCGDDLLELLGSMCRRLSDKLRLKILVTSRYEGQLPMIFEDIGHVSLRLDEVERAKVDDDIRTYLADRLREIARKHVAMDPNTWPLEADLAALVEHSGGSFAFAALAIQYVDVKGSPTSRLHNLLSRPVAKTSEELDVQIDGLRKQFSV